MHLSKFYAEIMAEQQEKKMYFTKEASSLSLEND